MTVMNEEIIVATTRDRVFDYVTNPGTWTEWYPLTTGVDWPHDRPAQVGEGWDEHVEMHVELIKLPLYKGTFSWKVIESDPPNRFVYDGSAKGDGIFDLTSGGTAEIVYTFTELAEGTKFHRRLEYTEPNAVVEVFDALIYRHIIEKASAHAVANMKRILESRK